VTGRFRSKNPDALEIVLELLGQVMMRHSKAQTLADGLGQQVPIVSLPPITETKVFLDWAGKSEEAVYLAIEALVQARAPFPAPLDWEHSFLPPTNSALIILPSPQICVHFPFAVVAFVQQRTAAAPFPPRTPHASQRPTFHELALGCERRPYLPIPRSLRWAKILAGSVAHLLH
jgi:hypothetical protein